MGITLDQACCLISAHGIDQGCHQHFSRTAFRISGPLLLLSAEVSLDDLSLLSVKRYAETIHVFDQPDRRLCQVPHHVRIGQITSALHGVQKMLLHRILFSHDIQRGIDPALRKIGLRPFRRLK